MTKTNYMTVRERIAQERQAEKHIAEYDHKRRTMINIYATRCSAEIYLRMSDSPVKSKMRQKEITRCTISTALQLIAQGHNKDDVLMYAKTFFINMLPEADAEKTIAEPVKRFDWKI